MRSGPYKLSDIVSYHSHPRSSSSNRTGFLLIPCTCFSGSYCKVFAMPVSLSGILFFWLNLSHNSGLDAVLNPPNRLSVLSNAVFPLSYPMAHLPRYSVWFPSKLLSLPAIPLFTLGFSPLHLLPRNIRSTIPGIFYVPFFWSPGPRTIPDT